MRRHRAHRRTLHPARRLGGLFFGRILNSQINAPFDLRIENHPSRTRPLRPPDPSSLYRQHPHTAPRSSPETARSTRSPPFLAVSPPHLIQTRRFGLPACKSGTFHTPRGPAGAIPHAKPGHSSVPGPFATPISTPAHPPTSIAPLSTTRGSAKASLAFGGEAVSATACAPNPVPVCRFFECGRCVHLLLRGSNPSVTTLEIKPPSIAFDAVQASHKRHRRPNRRFRQHRAPCRGDQQRQGHSLATSAAFAGVKST